MKNKKLMTVIILLPYLSPRELFRFCSLNKACYQLLLSYINFQVLFEAWGFHLTPDQLEEIRISTSKALKVTAKYMMIKSIVKSQHIIGKDAVGFVTDSSSIPDITTIGDKNWEEIRQLTFLKV